MITSGAGSESFGEEEAQGKLVEGGRSWRAGTKGLKSQRGAKWGLKGRFKGGGLGGCKGKRMGFMGWFKWGTWVF